MMQHTGTMGHLKPPTENLWADMEDILCKMLGIADDLSPDELLGTLDEPEAGVSDSDDSVVPSSTFVELKPALAAPEEPNQFVDLQPMNCDIDVFFSSQVSEGACTC